MLTPVLAALLLAKLGFQPLARSLPCLPVRTGIAAAPSDGCSVRYESPQPGFR